MQFLCDHKGGKGPQTLFQLQVSSFVVSSAIVPLTHLTLWSQDRLLLRQFLHTHFFQIRSPTLCAQSKECQKSHWKTAHKAVCTLQQTQLSQDLEEKAQVKKVNRWINVWSPVITMCLPTALDLVNHQWGRHETHTYVHPPALTGSF